MEPGGVNPQGPQLPPDVLQGELHRFHHIQSWFQPLIPQLAALPPIFNEIRHRLLHLQTAVQLQDFQRFHEFFQPLQQLVLDAAFWLLLIHPPA